jgi:hypothetical protein
MLENEFDWPELSAMTGKERIHVFNVVSPQAGIRQYIGFIGGGNQST